MFREGPSISSQVYGLIQQMNPGDVFTSLDLIQKLKLPKGESGGVTAWLSKRALPTSIIKFEGTQKSPVSTHNVHVYSVIDPTIKVSTHKQRGFGSAPGRIYYKDYDMIGNYVRSLPIGTVFTTRDVVNALNLGSNRVQATSAYLCTCKSVRVQAQIMKPGGKKVNQFVVIDGGKEIKVLPPSPIKLSESILQLAMKVEQLEQSVKGKALRDYSLSHLLDEIARRSNLK